MIVFKTATLVNRFDSFSGRLFPACLRNPGVLSLAIVLFYVAGLCLLFSPRWETNDDIAMSMIAHGYGFAAFPSEKLVFSNVIWGHFVQAFPAIKGVPGYSIATISVLIIVGWCVLYSVHHASGNYALAALAMCMVMFRPILLPQFTVNAGMLAVAAVVMLWTWQTKGSHWLLVVGFLLLFVSFLIRYNQSLLVLLCGAFLLPLGALRSNRVFQSVALATAVLMALAAIYDHASYLDPLWQDFWRLHLAHLPLTNYSAGEFLKLHQDILSKYGYSTNDIDLLANWFFADRAIADSGKLEAMFKELGPLPSGDRLQLGLFGLRALWSDALIPLVAGAFALSVLRPGWRVVGTWALCFGAAFGFGFVLSRPGVERVYVPLVALLLLVPLIAGRRPNAGKICEVLMLAFCTFLVLLVFGIIDSDNSSGLVKRQSVLVFYAPIVIVLLALRRVLSNLPAVSYVASMNASLLAVVLVFFYQHCIQFFPKNSEINLFGKEVRRALAGMPAEVIPVVWAAYFPFELTYPVLKPPRALKIYWLASFTHAPHSLSFVEGERGNDFRKMLMSPSGVPLIANEATINNLDGYCRERLDGVLNATKVNSYGYVSIKWLTCVPKIHSANSASGQ